MAEYAMLLSLSLGRMVTHGVEYLISHGRQLLPLAVGVVLLILLIVRLIRPPKV